MSFVLGIDTSSVELGMGLTDHRQSILGLSRYVRNSHAEHISKTVQFFLESNGITPADISHTAIAVGPGSFTGLRIGISFLKGFCFATGIRVLPVSSLESMAGAWPCLDKPIVAAFDARNGEVFWARFLPAKGVLCRQCQDQLTDANALKEAIGQDDTVITDTLGYAKSSVFSFLASRRGVYPVEQHPIQRGLSCARLGMRMLAEEAPWVSASDVLPQYLSATTMEKRLAGKT